MTNPFQEISEFKGQRISELLEEICLVDIFIPVLRLYAEDLPTQKSVVKYIVWAYSLTSPKIHINADWQTNKKNIFSQAGIPDSLWQDVGELKNDDVVAAIDNWIFYQDNAVYTEWCKLKDLQASMQRSYSASDVVFDQKMKNAESSIRIKEMIRDAENELIQNNQKLSKAVEEVPRSKKKITTFGPETYSLK